MNYVRSRDGQKQLARTTLRTGSRLIAECFVFMFEDDRVKFKSLKLRVSAYSR